MTIYSLPSRRRALQMQQQPQRARLNREQQQQGSTEFQQERATGEVAGQPGALHGTRPSDSQGSKNGGHGGTPVGQPERGARNPRDAQHYIREASANVDA